MNKTTKLIKAGFFISLALLIPYIFHSAGLAGAIFLPMHLPVLLAGFILGKKYGLAVGFISPILSSILTDMPPLYPTSFAMAFELATYGFITGLLYNDKKMNIFTSLILAMLFGRFVSAIANILLLNFVGKKFILKAFLASAFITPIWGIIIQLILIPAVVNIYKKRVG
ncbi:Protein of unknown function [Caloramator fervidus]|uniref:Niacin transporter n=2 Tax=Caloramator fervidus TaxID=29344 RepID=A0A1H5XXQ1_9CLOT|nr:ECF transporter S component [Caloramator fervidus]SEG16481.1 Protein of unknown function [Caloramator fervidus]